MLSRHAARRDIFDKVTWREPLARGDEYGATGVFWYCLGRKKRFLYPDMCQRESCRAVRVVSPRCDFLLLTEESEHDKKTWTMRAGPPG